MQPAELGVDTLALAATPGSDRAEPVVASPWRPSSGACWAARSAGCSAARSAVCRRLDLRSARRFDLRSVGRFDRRAVGEFDSRGGGRIHARHLRWFDRQRAVWVAWRDHLTRRDVAHCADAPVPHAVHPLDPHLVTNAIAGPPDGGPARRSLGIDSAGPGSDLVQQRYRRFENASRSLGCLEVTRFRSTTTSLSTTLAPAASRSTCTVFQAVMVRPSTTPAVSSSWGP